MIRVLVILGMLSLGGCDLVRYGAAAVATTVFNPAPKDSPR